MIKYLDFPWLEWGELYIEHDIAQSHSKTTRAYYSFQPNRFDPIIDITFDFKSDFFKFLGFNENILDTAIDNILNPSNEITEEIINSTTTLQHFD